MGGVEIKFHAITTSALYEMGHLQVLVIFFA
jgi:hypothetical protein